MESDILRRLDALEFYRESPIPLRGAKVHVLAQLPGFSWGIARHILQAFHQIDTNLYEYPDTCYTLLTRLLSNQLSVEQISILRMCTRIQPEYLPVRAHYRSRFTYTAQQLQGGKPIYPGPDYDESHRIQCAWPAGGLKAGIQYNRDRGEPYTHAFTSGFIQYTMPGSTIIAGDYLIGAGTGALLWSGTGRRRSADAFSALQSWNTGILPYRSSMEQGFFRGIAASYSIPLHADSSAFTMIGWYSDMRRAAVADQNGIYSFPTDGLFRTASEQRKYRAIAEKSAGFVAEWQYNHMIKGGVSALFLHYPLPVFSQAQMSFPRRENMLMSAFIHISGTMRQHGLRAEIIADGNTGAIGMHACYTNGISALQWGGSLRLWPGNLRSPIGHSVGHYAIPGNETGLGFNVEYKPFQGLTINSLIDIFITPSLRYGSDFPVHGDEISTQIIWKKGSEWYSMGYRIRNKSEGFTLPDSTLRIHTVQQQQSIRLETGRQINTLRLKLRIESIWTSYRDYSLNTRGLLAFADLNWQNSSLQIKSRISAYSTDDYSSALWTLEPGLNGMMNNPVHSGRGYSLIYAVQYKVLKNGIIGLWLRLRQQHGQMNSERMLRCDIALQTEYRW
jgi:hypothetical protein